MRGFKNLGAAFTGLIFLVAIAGCGGGGSASTGGGGGTGGGVSSPANSVYVTQTTSIVTPASASSNVLQFPRSDTGSVAPTATITGPPGIQFGFLTIDHNSSLYVAGTIYSSTCNSPTSGGSEILVFAPGATGQATPARTITGGATELQSLCSNVISGIDVDSGNNIYASTGIIVGSGPTGIVYQGIAVFSPTANGDVAPSKSIAGPSTTIVEIGQVAVDSAGTIYVANSTPTGPGSVLAFDSSATGDAVPTSTLAGSNTTIYYIRGIAVDGAKTSMWLPWRKTRTAI